MPHSNFGLPHPELPVRELSPAEKLQSAHDELTNSIKYLARIVSEMQDGAMSSDPHINEAVDSKPWSIYQAVRGLESNLREDAANINNLTETLRNLFL